MGLVTLVPDQGLPVPSQSTRAHVLGGVLIAASCLVGYLLVEAGHRFYAYHRILADIVTATVVQIPTDGQPSSVYDALIGYRYRPNIEVGPAAVPFPVHYRTNRHGLIAREDFPTEKPADEFRIGVIGDSFTANVTSTLRWTDVLEDTLNASPEWRAMRDGRHTRVVNFALDGIGTVQFGAIAERVAVRFDLDLLIVNMIKNDLIRRPHVRGHGAIIGRTEIAPYVRQHVLSQLDWFEIYPEALAAVLGPRFGLPPHLTLRAIEAAASRDIYYASAEDAASAAAASIETVLIHFPTALFLLDTTYAEYLGAAEPTGRLEDEVFADIRAQFPSIHWENVIAPGRAPRSRAEVDAWFNVPSDQHKNDVGVWIYGEAVAAFLTAAQRNAGLP
jgi:hypothetical protein